MTQRALDMLAGVYVQGRTEGEAALPLHTQLTAIGELHSTTRQAAVSLGTIRCRDSQVLALRVIVLPDRPGIACPLVSLRPLPLHVVLAFAVVVPEVQGGTNVLEV